MNINAPIHVLFIEDNPGDARLIQEELRTVDSSATIHLDWVKDFQQGLEHLGSNNLQAVLLDLNLPDGQGLEALKYVLAHAPSLPVIVMTGQADEAVAIQALQAGAQDYLVKGKVEGRLLTCSIRYAIQRKQTEIQLADALQFTERMLASSPVGILIYKLSGECVSANAYVAEMVGATVEQLKNQNFHDIESWKKSGLYELAEQAITRKKLAAADIHIITSFGKEAWVRAQFVTFQSGGEELLLLTLGDITERKRAEEAVRESEENYRQLFEAESDAIFLIENETGQILQANQAACVLYGYSQEELLSKKNSDLSAEPEQTQHVTQKTPVAADQVITIPLRFHRRKDGTVFPVEITGRFFVHRGRPVHIAAIRDITERRRAEAALRESEARYRMLFESNPHPMWVYDLETLQFLAVNDTAVAHYGFSREEFLSMTIREIRPAEDVRALMTNLTELPQNLHARSVWRHLKKDGTLIDVEITSHTMQWEARPARLVLAHDVTHRKRAEAALRDSEARYRLVTHATKDVIWEWSSKTKHLSWTDNAQLAFGYSPAEIGPDESWWDDHIHPEDRQRVISDLNAVIAGRESIWSGEYRFLLKDGSYANVSDHAYIERDPAGNPIRMVGAMSNVTERRRAEEALRESEEKIQNIIKHSSSMFYTHTPDGVLVYVSPQSRMILDCEPEEAMVSWQEFLSDHPANRQGIEVTQRAIETAQRQEPYDLELITRQGRRIWVQVDESPVVKDGKTVAIVGSVTDITERKNAEDALREKERLLSEAQRIGHIGSWNYDISADALKYSDEMYRLFDVSPQEFQHNSEGFLGVIHSSDRPTVAKWMKNISIGEQAGEIEFLVFRRNGELRYIRCRGAVEFDKTGKPRRFIGTAQDVTERKLAEIQIRQQIERLTALRKIDEAIISSFDLHSNLNTILSQLTSQLHVDAADVLLLDPNGHVLTYGAGQGFRTHEVETPRISTEESQAWRAARERRSIYVQNLENKPHDRLLTTLRASEDFVCYFGLPLIVKGKVKGVLEVFHRTPLHPYAEWLDFLNTLAGQTAIAIENAQLFKNR